MNSFEKCKKLRNSIGEYGDKIVALKKEIVEKNEAQRRLDEDALKAEILEEKNWKKKKEAADINRETISKLKEKIEETQRAIEILKAESEKVKREALRELKEKYMGSYTEAVKVFLEKAREAEKAEQNFRKIKDDADTAAVEIDPSGAAGVPQTPLLPFLKSVLTPKVGDLPQYTKLNFFIEDCKNQGIKIE